MIPITLVSGEAQMPQPVCASINRGEAQVDAVMASASARRQCPHVLAAFFGQPWAILPEKLQAIAEFLEVRAVQGMPLSAEDIDAVVEAARGPTPGRTQGGVAVIPILGVISHRMNLMSAMSGGTSTQAIGAEIDAAMGDTQVGSILLDIESPGGAVTGVQELAAKIREAAKTKPIIAVASAYAASAAYWLASQASSISVTPSGEVGSIGVRAMHQDLSAAYEAAGVKTTLVSAGKFKGEGSEFEELTLEARDALQQSVDGYYDDFVAAVASGRGVSKAEVRNGFGQGRMVRASEAVKIGMADRVETLDQALSRLVGRQEQRARTDAVLSTRRQRVKLDLAAVA